MTEQATVIETGTAVERFEHRAPGVPVAQISSSQALVELAIRTGDLDKLQKAMELQERWEANEARKAYYASKAAFKAEVPAVVKDKENTQYKSMYATEDALFNTVNPVLAKHGLETSFSYPKSEDPKMFIVRCTLTHSLGHSEFVDADGPLDTSGSKNPLQQSKSTRTYLKKESYTAITGIASADAVDDDGNDSGGAEDPITETQIADIETMVTDLIATKLINDEADFVSRLNRLFKKDKVDDLTEKQAVTLIKKLSAIK